jgi:MYXO-CTERM domain-containing protein
MHCTYRLPILAALGICSTAHSATITLLNGNFATGSGTTATSWVQTDGTGGNSPPSNYWVTSGVPGITTGAIYLKSDGGNYIQQALTASDLGSVDATTFTSYTVGLDYGYRHDSVINGDHTLRISLWNVTDNVEITGTDLLVAAPGSPGTNSLTTGSFVLNYDNTAGTLTGDQIAIRFSSTSGDLAGNSWQRTAILDNVTITAVPEPAAALLAGLGAFALLRRRRA